MRLFLEFLSLSRHHPLAPSVLRNFKNFIFVTQSWCTLCPQDIPLTLRSMDRKPIRTKMQVRHQKPFKCLYYLIIWWFGDHLIICSSSGNLVIIWLSGYHQELLLNGVDCMIVSHSLRSLRGGSDILLLSIVIIWWSSGDHLVIIWWSLIVCHRVLSLSGACGGEELGPSDQDQLLRCRLSVVAVVIIIIIIDLIILSSSQSLSGLGGARTNWEAVMWQERWDNLKGSSTKKISIA